MSQELEGTLTNTANLVGTFGSEGGGGTSNYNDLINKPSINSVTLQGNKTASQLGFAEVATSGSYDDLTNKPTIPAAQVNSDWNATSGVAEILNKPTIPAAQVNSDWNATSGVAEILNKPTLAAVATSGAYSDLTGTPTIPAAQVNSDWNASSGVAEILNKPTVYQNAAELPVSSTDPTDTKSYIDTALAQTIPTITANTTYTSSLDINCYTWGKMVYAQVKSIVPRVAIGNEEELATGFPVPISTDVRVSLTDRKTGVTYRAIVNSSGALKNWYSTNPIPTSAELFGTIVYIKA